MFDELDNFMHERPVNQMALAAWAMRMHAYLKKELPRLESRKRFPGPEWLEAWAYDFYAEMTKGTE